MDRLPNVSNRYLGLEFKIHGKIRYGWARLSVTGSFEQFKATLTGYAYETVPNKIIVAGRTSANTDGSTGSLGSLARGIQSALPEVQP